MSFCSRLIYFNQNKSLPKYRKANCCKKAFLHIRSKGSYTLEMAVVLPLVTAFMVSILFFFRVLQVQTQVQEALVYASRQTAAQASIGDSSAALFASAEMQFRKELQQHKEYRHYVSESSGGVSLLLSDFEGPEITLRADYYIKLPITIFTQIYLTSSKKVMGKYANSTGLKMVLWAVAIVVTALNIGLFVTGF